MTASLIQYFLEDFARDAGAQLEKVRRKLVDGHGDKGC
jgi:hypothetical protein